MTEAGLILKELLAAVESGHPVAVATIVSRVGSSPRDVGAKMLIFPDGSTVGTIGGGKFEHRVIHDSLEMFAENHQGALREYRFSQQGEGAIGMTCGGEAEVFIELFQSPERLLIFGGGHVGRELARLAHGSNFLVTIIDDRPESLDQYGESVRTVQCDANYRGDLPELSARDYIVIVTRSHESDYEVLKHYINNDCAYIGMMGSRAKIKRLFDHLRDVGVSEEQLARVHAPIGKEIGAEGPYEIGISILAELIETRRKVHKST